LASSPGQQDRIGLGDSQGGFIDSGLRIGSARMPGVSAAGDLDADGDIDILLNQYDPQGQKVVWLNTIGE